MNQKKVILASFSDINKDGRLKELFEICNYLGEVKIFDRSKRSFFKYIWDLFREKKCEYFVIDNRAILPIAILFIFLKKPKYIIQDCREMYFFKEQKTLKSKIGCMFENFIIKKATIVLTANHYRARIMKKYYSLKTRPIVFENIRYLEKKEISTEIKDKYNYLNKLKTFKIVSTAGYEETFVEKKLVDEVADLEGIDLFFIGVEKRNNKEVVKKNIHFLPKLSLEELKIVLGKMDVGYVGYDIINLNTKYCASGKIYEYLYEELPILAYKNIPLKAFVEENKVGLSGDNFKELIKNLQNNYENYKKNTIKLKNKLEILKENNEKNVALGILNTINSL